MDKCVECDGAWFKHAPGCSKYRVLRGDHNVCTSCGEYFKSTRAFEKHRVGMKCLDVEQMKSRGMVQVSDKVGNLWWINEEFDEKARERLRCRRNRDL